MAELFEVILTQTIFGVETINRWNYVGSGTPAAVSMSFALWSAFGGLDLNAVPHFVEPTVMRKLERLQMSSVHFDALAVKNVYSVTDFYESPYGTGVVGQSGTGDAMRASLAYPFRTNIVRSDIRRGQKRITGVGDAFLGADGVIQSGAESYAADLATAMSATLTYTDEGNTLTFIPCIVGQEKYTTVEPALGVAEKFAYRYYADKLVQLEHVAQGVIWTARNRATHQDSRDS